MEMMKGKRWWFDQGDEDDMVDVIEEMYCWEFLGVSSL